ncbi:MAG: hypothetical protein GX132_02395 [Erysipelotrichia bacterium]|nr:hypothetical protein [Erysipelotrichia bacterium]
MKYKYGDIFHYKPSYYLPIYKTGFDPLQILRFDETRQRYLCFIFDMDGTSDTWHLAYIKEEDLEALEKINEDANKWRKANGSPIVDEDLDTRYFKIYVYDGLELKLIQNDVGKRKNTYDLPTRNK